MSAQELEDFVTVRISQELNRRIEGLLGPEFQGRMKVTLRAQHVLWAWLKERELARSMPAPAPDEVESA